MGKRCSFPCLRFLTYAYFVVFAFVCTSRTVRTSTSNGTAILWSRGHGPQVLETKNYVAPTNTYEQLVAASNVELAFFSLGVARGNNLRRGGTEKISCSLRRLPIIVRLPVHI